MTEEQVAQTLLDSIARACSALNWEAAAQLTEAYVKFTRVPINEWRTAMPSKAGDAKAA